MTTFIHFFYNTKVVSIYEYLEKRFGSKEKVCIFAAHFERKGAHRAEAH